MFLFLYLASEKYFWNDKHPCLSLPNFIRKGINTYVNVKMIIIIKLNFLKMIV